MPLHEDSPTYVLVYHRTLSGALCPHCGRRLPVEDEQDVQLEITKVKAGTDHFELHGSGRFTGVCPRCGIQVEALQRHIPVHCVGLKCNKCGESEELKLQVRSLNTADREFEFEAVLECQRCRRTNRLTKILNRLSEILSIEIGLTGITLKAKGEKESDK